MKKIPALDLSPEIEALWVELNAAVQDVAKLGSFIVGPEVKQLELEVNDDPDVEHAIEANSGADT